MERRRWRARQVRGDVVPGARDAVLVEDETGALGQDGGHGGLLSGVGSPAAAASRAEKESLDPRPNEGNGRPAGGRLIAFGRGRARRSGRSDEPEQAYERHQEPGDREEPLPLDRRLGLPATQLPQVVAGIDPERLTGRDPRRKTGGPLREPAANPVTTGDRADEVALRERGQDRDPEEDRAHRSTAGYRSPGSTRLVNPVGRVATSP